MKLGSIRKYIGNKEFYKELAVVALPIALQQFVSAVVNAIDTMMVAGWGQTTATAAVSIANRYFNSFNAIMIAIAVSCSVFVAQFYGAKRNDKLKQMFGFNIIITLLFATIAFIFGFAFKEQIIEFFTGTVDETSQDPNFRLYGIEYLAIIVFSFFPLAFTNAFTFTFRPIKLTKVPLISAMVAAISNAILNYIFIYGHFGMPALGVQGAAIATLISRVVELLILVIYYYATKPAFFGTLKEIFVIPHNLFAAVFIKARPLVFAQFLTEAMIVFMLFVYASIEKGNPSNIAAINVSQQIVDIVIVFIGGMGTAASILVGARLGAGKIEEARQNARWQMAYVCLFSIIACIAMIALIPLAKILFGFSDEEQGVLRSVMILHALALPFAFYAINVIFITRSGGYTKGPIYITNMVYYLIKLPIIIVFVYIAKDVFFQITFLQDLLKWLNLEASLLVFIFTLDKVVEVIRALVAHIIYRRVHWWNNLNSTVN